MIILEGADGSGKSTVGNSIQRSSQLELIHAGGPLKDSEEFRRRCELQLSSFGKILDRISPISELVYGSILRGHTLIPELEIWGYIESFIADKWMMVYCRPGIEILMHHAINQMDKDTEAQGKTYKPAAHSEQVKVNICSIVYEYDRIVETIRDAGMPVLIHLSRDTLSNFLKGR